MKHWIIASSASAAIMLALCAKDPPRAEPKPSPMPKPSARSSVQPPAAPLPVQTDSVGKLLACEVDGAEQTRWLTPEEYALLLKKKPRSYEGACK